MNKNEFWLKFIITGNPKDYLKYVENTKKNELFGGVVSATDNRWSCNKGDNYKGY